MEIFNKLAELDAQYRNARGVLIEELNTQFAPALGEILRKDPKIEYISWVQYTPRWNDGDTCTFYAHTDDFSINTEERGCCGENDDEEFDDIVTSEIDKFLNSITDETYEELFGDGKIVKVFNDGSIKTDWYHHD